MPEDIPVSDRVKKSFSTLSAVASLLNASSDKLSNNIATLEAELKKLSIGVSSSVIFDDRLSHSGGNYDFDRVGYSKVNGKWGFVIESMRGAEFDLIPEYQELWPICEAPRGKRVKAVKFIPELLDKLARDAAGMVADIDESSDIVVEITRALSPTTSLGALMKGCTPLSPEQLKEALETTVVAPGQDVLINARKALASRFSRGGNPK